MEKKISLEELTPQNVTELSEEDVFCLLTKDIGKLPKEKHAYYANLINTAFEFRTLSSKNRTLKGDLGIFGFKFFTYPEDNKLIMGVKRKYL